MSSRLIAGAIGLTTTLVTATPPASAQGTVGADVVIRLRLAGARRWKAQSGV